MNSNFCYRKKFICNYFVGIKKMLTFAVTKLVPNLSLTKITVLA